MKALEQKILKEGEVREGGVLKVGSFLNQQLDIPFLYEMGKEIAGLYKDSRITKVLTIEASGIAIAVPAAFYLGVNAVFVKKSISSNLQGDIYSAKIHSFTHGNDFCAVVSKKFLSPDDNVLIVDDFLAVGSALRGMISIVEQAGATVAGAAIAIEKAFQGGGDTLRSEGYRIESLALIESMDGSNIVFGSR